MRPPRCLFAFLLAVGCRGPSGAAVPPADAGRDAGEPPLARASIDVDAADGVLIPADFLGLSLEYGKSFHNAFGHAKHRNQGFARMLENLPRSVLRVGGNSTDETCFEGIASDPRACLIRVGTGELEVVAAVARETGWRFILGVNLAQGSPEVGVAYARQIAASVPRDAIEALEIGNEPDLYPEHTFRGTTTTIRPKTYDVHAGAREYASFADALRKDPKTRGLPLAGPALASKWAHQMKTAFLPEVTASRIDLVTTHHYPLSACRDDRKPDDPRAPTLAHLLAPRTMERLSSAIMLDVEAARSAGKPLEIDETNSVSCRGTEGVSDTFASAAWGVDYFFTAAKLGAARLNLHGGSETARYSPISPAAVDGKYENTAHPLYYAMLLFGPAEGARLLPVVIAGGGANVKVWAVTPKCDAPCPAVMVFVLNKDETAYGRVTIKPSRRLGIAAAVELLSSSVDAREATLGGRAVDPETGAIAPPETQHLAPDDDGEYDVELPRAAVVLLSIAAP